ncbi:hypothetical protein G6F57_015546 [Rhizopus arrhizus]|nr:hypothetical protein G6F57_015546 [Rhizopus arrhizus]
MHALPGFGVERNTGDVVATAAAPGLGGFIQPMHERPRLCGTARETENGHVHRGDATLVAFHHALEALRDSGQHGAARHTFQQARLAHRTDQDLGFSRRDQIIGFEVLMHRVDDLQDRPMDAIGTVSCSPSSQRVAILVGIADLGKWRPHAGNIDAEEAVLRLGQVGVVQACHVAVAVACKLGAGGACLAGDEGPFPLTVVAGAIEVDAHMNLALALRTLLAQARHRLRPPLCLSAAQGPLSVGGHGLRARRRAFIHVLASLFRCPSLPDCLSLLIPPRLPSASGRAPEVLPHGIFPLTQRRLGSRQRIVRVPQYQIGHEHLDLAIAQEVNSETANLVVPGD